MATRYKTKKIVVVGLGVSGLHTARALAEHGAHITISEMRIEADLDPDICRKLRDLGVELELGGHIRQTFLDADMIVISPGVPHNLEPLQAAREKGIQVIGEMEVAFQLTKTPIIAITGTNGKTTVTTLLGRLIENAGFDVFVGGNIGTPLIAHAYGGKKADYAIVEVSSFQLDTIDTFRPFISIILNISPDHLDRYTDYEDYVQSKLRIFMNQKPGQYLIVNDDDESLTTINPSYGPKVLRYGLKNNAGLHATIKDNEIIICLDDSRKSSFPVESYGLRGKHNLENLLAVVLAAQVLNIESPVLQKTINQFVGLPNRLEFVKDLDGITFYNDSKATNVDASVKAVSSFDEPIILIAGGRHKGADYGPLVNAAKSNVKKVIFLGEAKELLSASFGQTIPFDTAENMEEAVIKAFECAQNGDIVLLAPACSSFDMFSDYSHRGRVFKEAIERLSHGKTI